MGCIICYESLFNKEAIEDDAALSGTDNNYPAALSCGHIFHKSCIVDWFRGHNQVCPLCNKWFDGQMRKLLLDLDQDDIQFAFPDVSNDKKASNEGTIGSSNVVIDHKNAEQVQKLKEEVYNNIYWNVKRIGSNEQLNAQIVKRIITRLKNQQAQLKIQEKINKNLEEKHKKVTKWLSEKNKKIGQLENVVSNKDEQIMMFRFRDMINFGYL